MDKKSVLKTERNKIEINTLENHIKQLSTDNSAFGGARTHRFGKRKRSSRGEESNEDPLMQQHSF